MLRERVSARACARAVGLWAPGAGPGMAWRRQGSQNQRSWVVSGWFRPDRVSWAFEARGYKVPTDVCGSS